MYRQRAVGKIRGKVFPFLDEGATHSLSQLWLQRTPSICKTRLRLDNLCAWRWFLLAVRWELRLAMIFSLPCADAASEGQEREEEILKWHGVGGLLFWPHLSHSQRDFVPLSLQLRGC